MTDRKPGVGWDRDCGGKKDDGRIKGRGAGRREFQHFVCVAAFLFPAVEKNAKSAHDHRVIHHELAKRFILAL